MLLIKKNKLLDSFVDSSSSRCEEERRMLKLLEFQLPSRETAINLDLQCHKFVDWTYHVLLSYAYECFQGFLTAQNVVSAAAFCSNHA